MINLTALQKVLPACELQPNTVARIYGFASQPRAQAWKDNIELMEPPAGQHTPYVDPQDAMVLLFMHQGQTEADAALKANTELTKLREHRDPSRCVIFFDYFSWESPEHIPTSTLISYLRQNNLVSDHVATFLDHAVDATIHAASFKGPDNHETPWSLATLPDDPSPKAMIEFVPGYEWDEDVLPKFEEWRKSIRHVSDQLEQALGEPVYDFKVPDCETDDDNIHRFLFLHWICTYAPTSIYVRYLVARSGARDVEELKAALIHPDSYSHPFEMYDAFGGMACYACRFEYVPPDVRKRFGIVFLTESARAIAESLLIQKINYDVLLLAPEKLVDERWIKTWARFSKTWTIQYIRDDLLDNPIEFLAQIDELRVISGSLSPSSHFDLQIPNSIDELLCDAIHLGMDADYISGSGHRLDSPEKVLGREGVNERLLAKQNLRKNYTQQLSEIRVWCDFASSGLWNEQGKMLRYELLDLPFNLIRRIAAWQRDYDETNCPPQCPDKMWWNRHKQEKLSLAIDLQACVGAGIPVKLYRHDQWVCVTDINHSEGGA